MIEWASPWALILLIPVLLLPLQPRLTGVNRLLVPGPDVISSRMTPRLALAWLPRALQVIGLALLVIALARPRLSHRTTVVESEGLDIMLAVDTSGSMKAEDLSRSLRPVNRLEVAKGVLNAFIEGRSNDRIGLVVFGQEAFTHVPLTLDHDSLIDVLTQVQIGIAGENRTAIGSAIAVSAKRLKELEAPSKLVILLTDGQNNAGHWSPIEAANIAATIDIKVYTVGIGKARFFDQGGLDEETLKAIATATDAKYFRANSAQDLEQIYATIDELEPSPAEVDEIVQHEELFHYPLLPGGLLLALQMLLSATWLRRGP
jgi:Ca-activated chloride channel family protein